MPNPFCSGNRAQSLGWPHNTDVFSWAFWIQIKYAWNICHFHHIFLENTSTNCDSGCSQVFQLLNFGAWNWLDRKQNSPPNMATKCWENHPFSVVVLPFEVPLDPFEKDANTELDTFKENLGPFQVQWWDRFIWNVEGWVARNQRHHYVWLLYLGWVSLCALHPFLSKASTGQSDGSLWYLGSHMAVSSHNTREPSERKRDYRMIMDDRFILCALKVSTVLKLVVDIASFGFDNVW